MESMEVPDIGNNVKDRPEECGNTYRNIVCKVAATLDKTHRRPLEKLYDAIVDNKKRLFYRSFPEHQSVYHRELGSIRSQNSQVADRAVSQGGQQQEEKKTTDVSIVRALVALRHATEEAVSARDVRGIEKLDEFYPHQARLMESVSRPVEMPELTFRHFAIHTARNAELRVIERQLGCEYLLKKGRHHSFEFLCRAFSRSEMDKILKAEFLRLWQRELRHVGVQTVPATEIHREANYIEPWKIDQHPIITVSQVSGSESRKRCTPGERSFESSKKVKPNSWLVSPSDMELTGYEGAVQQAPAYSHQAGLVTASKGNNEFPPRSSIVSSQTAHSVSGMGVAPAIPKWILTPQHGLSNLHVEQHVKPIMRPKAYMGSYDDASRWANQFVSSFNIQDIKSQESKYHQPRERARQETRPMHRTIKVLRSNDL